MEIICTQENKLTEIKLIGRLDGNTSEKLLEAIRSCKTPSITLQCEELTYVSSAGLRVILRAHKQCVANQGTLTLTHITDMLKELLEMTGFAAFIKCD